VVTVEFPAEIGCVAIGRNEGERLRLCLESLGRDLGNRLDDRIVYVDSGSTDGSVALARALGCDVVELDLSIPFTAARARNAGYRRLLENAPNTEMIQFVDGDCEVVAGWLDLAARRLAERLELAVVCGRRRERHPERTVYNRLCDMEWNTPVGEARACGGDAMIKTAALARVGGYDETLISGEEPELCVRLRKAGYHIERLDAEMTRHDAAILHFAQWWRRNVRSGHAYAEGAAMHGAPPERHFVRESRRAWFWAAILPAVSLGAAIPTLGASLVLLAGYGVSAARVYRGMRVKHHPQGHSALAAVFTTAAKFAELQGILTYEWNYMMGRRAHIIEYKNRPREGV
jgi:GT2 family glycosyltransferase